MSSTPWILISIVILLVILGIVAIIVAVKRKKKHKTDYYTFFIMGIIWFAMGLPLKNSALWAMGLIFAIYGLAHKKEWKANHQANRWENLEPFERKLKVGIIIGLGLLVLAGLIVFYLFRKGAI